MKHPHIFYKTISGIGLPSECLTVWIQLGPDALLNLIWIQTVCKGNQQKIKVVVSRRVFFKVSSKIGADTIWAGQ